MSPMVDWHARYVQQAVWTSQTRHYLYGKADVAKAEQILEVGCGTGAILAELPTLTKSNIHGIDIDFPNARMAGRNADSPKITCGDGNHLPYPPHSFDVVLCHFLLLWVESPLEILKEMKRVTKTGGSVMALAEPDYSSRIDYPSALEPLGKLQAKSLEKQGADPEAGRRLRSWFVEAGLHLIESGIMAGGWSTPPNQNQRELEWAVVESDLAGELSNQEIEQLKLIDKSAWETGIRVLFVPTFYAWGRV